MPPTSPLVPIHIRPGNLRTSAAIESRIHQKLDGVLRHFGAQMTAVEVYFEDVNGPKRGGDDVRCTIEARVIGRRSLVVTARTSDLYAAIDIASRRLESALSSVVQRGDARARRAGRTRHVRAAGAVSTGLHNGRPRGSTHSSGPLAPQAESHEPRGRVIIAGYGPVGRALAEELAKLRVPFAVVDTNPDTARTLESRGVPVLCGDVTDPEVLREIGIEAAAAIAITIPDGDEAVRACAAARRQAPAVHIAVRTTFLSQGLQAIRAGANSITVEEIATAQAMARNVSLHIAGSPANQP